MPTGWMRSRARPPAESFRYGYGRILCGGEYVTGCAGKVGCEVGDKIQSQYHHDEADDECLHHIAVGDGQDDGEHVNMPANEAKGRTGCRAVQRQEQCDGISRRETTNVVGCR